MGEGESLGGIPGMSVGAQGSLVITPARKVADEGSAVWNPVRADFSFRNSVCFQREKGRTQNGRNTGEAHFKLGFVSLGVSSPLWEGRGSRFYSLEILLTTGRREIQPDAQSASSSRADAVSCQIENGYEMSVWEVLLSLRR